MKVGRFVGVAVVGVLLAWAPPADAQEATLSGTVRDNTGGVLPGVTVTATHEAQGTTYETVTDEQGLYRLQVRAGAYRISAALPGFTTVMRPGVELLLGRQSMLNLDLGVSGVQETVTVTGEAPLIDTTTSNIAGNIDPRQMQDLPINGRNWMDLTMLAPGSRSNSAAEIPQNRQGMFQINVDGQQVTFTLCCFENQPRYSRDAIAEFELTTNRFDATKGRTSGMMVNAITKSGTNTPSGTFSGYFRDDRFNAADFIQHRVIPYSDQQYSGTFGGPIVRDRIHFFVNGEWEREPSTVTFNSPYSSFNIDLTQPRKEQKWGPKIDWQFTPQARLMSRYTRYQNVIPYLSTGGATNHPSTAQQTQRIANQSFTEFNQVLSSRRMQGGAARATGGRRGRRRSSATCSAARKLTAASSASRSRVTRWATTTTRKARASASTTSATIFRPPTTLAAATTSRPGWSTSATRWTPPGATAATGPSGSTRVRRRTSSSSFQSGTMRPPGT
jgi:hypothetical protein